MNTRSKKVLATVITVGMVGSLIGLCQEPQKPKRKRMEPDDPPGTRVFAETLPPALEQEVQRLIQKYEGTNAPDPKIHEWIDNLASYESVRDPDYPTMGMVDESSVAWRKIRGLGISALSPLIRATARANKTIRGKARGLIVEIGSSNNLEMELLPVFLRGAHVLGERQSLIGCVGQVCASLARKKRYSDCETCLKHIAHLATDNDEEVSFLAVAKLEYFDRLDLVPEEILAKPGIKTRLNEWVELRKGIPSYGRFPLPKPKQPEGGTPVDGRTKPE